MIAVTFALPAESSDLLRRLPEHTILRRSALRIIDARFSGHQIHIVHTGVGTVASRERLEQYFAAFTPSRLISSGFAGGSRSNYRVSDLLLAQNFSDPELLLKARRVLSEQNVHTGSLFTAGEMIDSAEEREKIWREQEAVAIDMETETIADVCAARRIPLLSLRVLSDTPRHPFPLPAAVLFDVIKQRVPAARLTKHLLAHPGSIPALLRFGRQIKRARHSLTAALVKILQAGIDETPG